MRFPAGCYGQNGNPGALAIGQCIVDYDGLGARGVTVVLFGNGLRGYSYPTYLYFVDVPVNGPDTTVVILQSAPPQG